jgi:RimJ/RimL family protein N-acetyltransferase
MSVQGTYTTVRLRLRPLGMGDLDALVALHNDPEVMRYLSRKPVPRETVEGQLRSGRWGAGYWAADRLVDDAFLGWFALRSDPARDPVERELGYRLARTAWGRGVATEGATALVAAAFADGDAEPPVGRVRAQTMAVNLGSRRVMEKVGLRHVRTWHEHWDDPLPGTEEGEVEYAVTRAEWQSRSG